MGWKTDNKPVARYYNEDGSFSAAGKGDTTSSADPFGNLQAAAGGHKAPADSPEITDEVVRKRRAAEMTRLMLGVGRKSTFSEGGMGNLNLGQKMLGGK